MKKIALLAGLLLANPTALRAEPAAQSDPLVDRAITYLKAQESVMQGQATIADVDRLMTYYTPDYVYRDAAVGITVRGVGDVRRGSASHLGESRDAKVSVDDAVAVGQSVALKVRTSFTLTENGQRVDRTNLVVLKYAGEKIAERTDY